MNKLRNELHSIQLSKRRTRQTTNETHYLAIRKGWFAGATGHFYGDGVNISTEQPRKHMKMQTNHADADN